jgi:hypothetical protein
MIEFVIGGDDPEDEETIEYHKGKPSKVPVRLFGECILTDKIKEMMAKGPAYKAFVEKSLQQFYDLDWGDITEVKEDVEANYDAIKRGCGSTIFGIYNTHFHHDKEKEYLIMVIYIICNNFCTDSTDMQITGVRPTHTVLFPSEY